ncbi:LysR family transcriptional regulator [Thiohalorhabdus sp. Cl-TMA]|uniref:LysR substrate-binding domain-containing protein n=1 Tax=Thiohalorhabdus methylotrophus TaxID=3242694 RepID=A0ABV4TTU9_9GAMM
MHLTLRQLQVFEAVARHLNFTRAADELFMTQPAVSGHIRQMEEEAGLPLIEHVGKRLYLTEAGAEVQRAALDVRHRLEDLEMSMADLAGMVRGNLRLAVTTTAKYFAPHLLGVFSRRFPGVEIRLEVSNRENVLDRLASNEDELAIMGRVPQGMSVTGTAFTENPLVVVAPAEHPLAGERDIAPERLAEESFLVREAGSGTRLAMEQYFAEHGLSLKGGMELGSNETIKQAVMAGLGLSVLSLHTLPIERSMGRLVILDVAGFPLKRHWYAVHLKEKKLSVVARTFLDFLTEEGGALVEQVASGNGISQNDV